MEKKDMKTRILSLFLALAMIATFPASFSSADEITATPVVSDCNDCKNCSDCGLHGGKFGFGRVTNTGEQPTVQDALAVLRFIVGLPSPITENADARAAANITTPGSGDPSVQDALAILRFLVNLSSPGLDEVYRPALTANVGDIIQFGGYDWRVLEVRDGKALLLSDRVFEPRHYHTESTDLTWETCSLRAYLNGEFYNSFSVNDRARIADTTVINNDHPWYGTPGGNNTTDKIFLLSTDEVRTYLTDNALRIALNASGEASWWWLRSPGQSSNSAENVGSDGGFGNERDFFVNGISSVRPALWFIVNL
jgi:hypothetical protein